MRAVPRWLAAIVLIASSGAGCSSHDRPDGERHQSEHIDDHPVSSYCSSRIDDQITAGIIPNADREYATGMCEALRR